MIGMADTINAIRPALDEMAEARAEVARLTAELAAARAVPADVEAAIIAYRDAAQSFGMSALIDGGAALRTAIARAISDATAARDRRRADRPGRQASLGSTRSLSGT